MSFYRSKMQAVATGFSSHGLTDPNQDIGQVALSSGDSPGESTSKIPCGVCQNLVLCGCGTEVLTSLAVRQGDSLF